MTLPKDADQREFEILKKRFAKSGVAGLEAVDDVSELLPVLQKNVEQNTKALDSAVKEILAEDFSLVGIDDPSEALHVLESKLAGMSTLDRATTFTRLGEKLKETQEAPVPRRWKILSYLILAAIAWVIWRPLGAVFIIVATGNVRYFVMNRARLWTRTTALIFGMLYGCFLATLVKAVALFSVQGTVGNVVLVILGLIAAVYVAWVPPSTLDARLATPAAGELKTVRVGVAWAYAIGTLVLFAIFGLIGAN